MSRFAARELAAALLLVHAVLGASLLQAAPIETRATQALMVDVETGSTLYAKLPDTAFPPASLAKLMTMEIVFAALKSGTITLETTFPVSEDAWRRGGAPSRGSTMFAALKSSIRVGDLIQGVVVQGANDGCLILAEGMAGGEPAFVAQMNDRAKALGLSGTVFRNATGLPAEGQATTPRDLVTLATHLWRTYPEFYALFGQRDFTWNKITQRNRNPLLAMEIGADGLGTGATEGSGFAIVGSAQRGGRRVFLAMNGLKSSEERARESRALIEWGLSGFERVELFAKDDIVGTARVFGGDRTDVDLKATGAVAVLVPRGDSAPLDARIVYSGPVAAPVQVGAAVGILEVWRGDTLAQRVPLHAAEAVAIGALHRRAFDAIAELLTGWMRRALPS